MPDYRRSMIAGERFSLPSLPSTASPFELEMLLARGTFTHPASLGRAYTAKANAPHFVRRRFKFFGTLQSSQTGGDGGAFKTEAAGSGSTFTIRIPVDETADSVNRAEGS
jgi:hypothetical protein